MAVWLLYQRAVDVEPPVTDEVLLVEEGSVGAEMRVLDEVGVAEVRTDVESLALGLGVGVVTLNLENIFLSKVICDTVLKEEEI